MVTLLLLLALQDPSDELVERVRKYLKDGDVETGKSLEKVEIPVLERAVRAAFKKPAVKDAGTTATHEVASDVDASVKITYKIAIPGAAAKEGLRPCLVTLHGQGGDAADWLKLRLAEFKDQDFYILAPQAGKAGWGHSLLGYSHVMEPLKDALARYPIDPDRVWLDGFSMGANGTWQVGSLHPDRFAALAPRGGAPHFVKIKRPGESDEVKPLYARNLRALPLDWTVGAKDPGLPMDSVRALRGAIKDLGVDLTYKEIATGEHEWFPDETARIMEWMRGKTRLADPPEVRWTTFERIFDRAYWVEIMDFTAKETIKTPVKDFDGNVIERRTSFSSEVRVTAIAKRGSNRIDVSCDGVKVLKLRLNDRLVDLSKPVTVKVNGKTLFEGKVERSAVRLLDEVRRRGDPSFLYPAEVTIRVTQ